MTDDNTGSRWRWLLTWRGVVVAAALVAVAAAVVVRTQSGSTRGSEPPTASSEPSDAEALSGPIAPLTGLPDPSAAVERRCAVTVKIGNTAEARPQYGVEAADVVYEEVVEGGITRLAAVFHSQDPDRVGTVRSVRPIDQSIVWPLRGVFAYSGGTIAEVASLTGAPVTPLDETRAGALMFRDPERTAPHNLYARVNEMYDRCVDPPPAALFTFRSALAPSVGDQVTSVRVGFLSGYAVTWGWDTGSSRWNRSIFGAPDLSAAGAQLSAANVVVMQVQYSSVPFGDAAEAVMIGRGPVSVFSGGRVVHGTWARPDRSTAAQLLDDRQQPIPLTPGQTWVELPDLSYTVTTTP